MIRQARLCNYWAQLSTQYRLANRPGFRDEGVYKSDLVDYIIQQDGRQFTPELRAKVRGEINDLITDRFMEISLDAQQVIITADGRRFTKGWLQRWTQYGNVLIKKNPILWTATGLAIGWLTSPVAGRILHLVWAFVSTW